MNSFFSVNALQDGAKRGHFPTLVFLRACAVLLVMIFHIIPHETVEGIPVLEQVVAYGYTGLDMFFIISGFIVPYAMWKAGYTIRSFPRFLVKRLVRLEPPYLASLAFAIFMQWSFFKINSWDYTFDWPRILSHIGYLNQYLGYESFVSVYWSLALELQFYVLIGLLFAVLVVRYQWVAIIVLVGICSVTLLVFIPYNWAMFQYASMFSLGILLFLFAVGKMNKYVFIACVLALYWFVWYRNESDVLITATFTVLMLLFFNITWKPMIFIGTISYSIYLTHVDIAGWLKLYLKDYQLNTALLLVLCFTVAFLLAWGFYHVIERPAQRWSKKINYFRSKQ